MVRSFKAVSEDISKPKRPTVPVLGEPFIRTYHWLEGPQVGHFSITDSCRVELVLIQNSIVKSFVSKLPTEFPKLIWLSTPLKPNACPTLPFANEIAFTSVALFAPLASAPFPSPFHQLTRPNGGSTHAVNGE